MANADAAWACGIIDNQDQNSLEWKVEDEALLSQLIEHCHNASPYTQTFEIDEREGYNGVRLFNNDECYTAFVGKLTCSINGKTEIRTDLGRKLETMILSSAPEKYRQKAFAILAVDFD